MYLRCQNQPAANATSAMTSPITIVTVQEPEEHSEDYSMQCMKESLKEHRKGDENF